MFERINKIFEIQEEDSPKIIVKATKEVMMILNDNFSIKGQNEIINQVISNTIQMRELEIETTKNRLKELNEGNLYLREISKKYS